MQIIDLTHPQHKGLTNNKPKYVIVHHTASSMDTTPHDIINWHVNDRGWEYAGYHYIIDGKGRIWQTRPDTAHGAHEKNHNLDSIGIALVGNFNEMKPLDVQVEALTWLLKEVTLKFGIASANILTHRYAKGGGTDCPGTNLTDAWASSLVGSPVEPTPEPETETSIISNVDTNTMEQNNTTTTNTWGFLTATRFWAMVALAIVGVLGSEGVLGPNIVEALTLLLGGFVGVRTVDRFSEQVGKK